MANLNDFKLLNLKCRTYFNLLEKELGKTISTTDEKLKERFGFYLYMLEYICGIKDISDIVELITDQDFNKVVFQNNFEDFGVDAIHINNETNDINLFNFKFRESFNSDKKQSINETFLTTKFTNALVNNSTAGFKGKLKIKGEQIIANFKSNDIWKIKLYVVSNEAKELDIESPEIKQLKELYDLETIPIGLSTITKYMSLRPEAIDAILHLEKEAIMPFVEHSLASSKSYIIRITANELIRVTCDNKSKRDSYNIEDYSSLSESTMDYNLLFDNVRGLILGSKFNSNIADTLKSEPSKFFMYNNGLTITADDIIAEDTNANQKVKLTIKNFQVVNGGQTLRTLHNFNKQDKDNITKYLPDCELLLRIFKTTDNNDIKNRIAEYTNSQNAISSIDLKSLSSEQLLIEQFLDEHKIIYARKIGDTGKADKNDYLHKISMEKFGQILFSIKGNPEKASNQKKQIFDKYYKSIFEDGFELNKSAEYVTRYYEIKKIYDANKKGYDSTDQKIFYILYLDQILDTTIAEKITLLEKSLKLYKGSSDQDISDVRKIIQGKFKEFVTKKAQQIVAKSAAI